MRLLRAVFVPIVVFAFAPAVAQTADPRAMIRVAEADTAPAPAAIRDLAWLEGTWVGDMAGVGVEHHGDEDDEIAEEDREDGLPPVHPAADE